MRKKRQASDIQYETTHVQRSKLTYLIKLHFYSLRLLFLDASRATGFVFSTFEYELTYYLWTIKTTVSVLIELMSAFPLKWNVTRIISDYYTKVYIVERLSLDIC